MCGLKTSHLLGSCYTSLKNKHLTRLHFRNISVAKFYKKLHAENHRHFSVLIMQSTIIATDQRCEKPTSCEIRLKFQHGFCETHAQNGSTYG